MTAHQQVRSLRVRRQSRPTGDWWRSAVPIRPQSPRGGWPEWCRDSTQALEKLGQAFAAGRLSLASQAIVGREGAVFYEECLLRAMDELGAPFGPRDFIPSLEQFGEIGSLDRFMLNWVLVELVAAPDARLGCNVSGQSLSDPVWVESVIETLVERPVAMGRLVIEVTASSALFDFDRVAESIARLRMLGVRIALDNFGMGVATAAHLGALAPDIVKIVPKIAATACREGELRLLSELVEMGDNAGFEVVAEGVENLEQLVALHGAGIRFFQGFYLGAPAPFRFAADGTARVDPGRLAAATAFAATARRGRSAK